MKVISTILIAVVVLIASLFFVSSSICVVSSGMDAGGRALGSFIALLCLGVIIGGVFVIGRIHRNQ